VSTVSQADGKYCSPALLNSLGAIVAHDSCLNTAFIKFLCACSYCCLSQLFKKPGVHSHLGANNSAAVNDSAYLSSILLIISVEVSILLPNQNDCVLNIVVFSGKVISVIH
jgi:hypothetical protein